MSSLSEQLQTISEMAKIKGSFAASVPEQLKQAVLRAERMEQQVAELQALVNELQERLDVAETAYETLRLMPGVHYPASK